MEWKEKESKVEGERWRVEGGKWKGSGGEAEGGQVGRIEEWEGGRMEG